MLRQTALVLVTLLSLGLAGCDLLIPTPTVITGEGERPDEGEGEEGEGEEGEGDEGEGEGEGDEGEGEGDAAEGEGDGGVGEGEGEGDVVGAGTVEVSLVWDGPSDDLDVRGIADNVNAEYCAPASFFDNTVDLPDDGPLATSCTPDTLSCSFANCQAGDSTLPDWDGSGANSAGDPSIAEDFTNGPGPEVLTVGSIVSGNYLFGAFAYAVDAAVPGCATLTVKVGGTQRLQRSVSVVSGNWVELAEVSVVGSSITVTGLEGSNGSTCP